MTFQRQETYPLEKRKCRNVLTGEEKKKALENSTLPNRTTNKLKEIFLLFLPSVW